MRAVVIREHGGLDRLKIEEIPAPVPGDNEVVLKVLSAGLNHLDIWIRKGRSGLKVEMPHALGSDAAGVVTSIGANVKNINIGDEVVLNPGLSCGYCQFCKSAEQSLCPSFELVGMKRQGTFAEYVAVPMQNVYPKPKYMSFDEAGAFVLSYLTAWRMLMTRACVKKRETVLIHGIGGGVGLSALQLSKLAGVKAIVTSSSDEKLAGANKIGADGMINYRKTGDVSQCVMDLTSGKGVDAIIDTVGAATWPIYFSAAKRGGRIVLCGITSGAEATTDLKKLYWNQLTVMGSSMGSNDDLRKMLKAVTKARLKPIIDSVLPLEDVKKAMGKMEAAKQFGKIVLRILE